MTTHEYEQRADEFLTARALEHYRVGAGLAPTADISALYERFSGLFDLSLVRELLAERSDRQSRLIAEFAAFGYLDWAVREVTDQITNASAAAVVRWEGESISYLHVPVRLVNEPDVDRRHDLERLYVRATAELNDLRARRWDMIYESTERLGFPSYRALCDEIGDLALDRLVAEATAILEETEEAYLIGLDRLVHEIGIQPRDATPADLAYLCRGHRFDSYFPRGDLLDAYDRTLRGLGFRLESLRGLRIDLEPRPLKRPRAFCVAVHPPDDVRLVVLPKGGLDDYGAFFHEAGHATHFTNIRGNLSFAYRRLGEATLTETFAFLFESLTRDRWWLRRNLVDVPPTAYDTLAAFARLRLVRRYCAKLLYERDLHSGESVGDLPARYEHWLRNALVHRIWEEDCLADVDDRFYVAHYLRAWMLEAQLRQYLIREISEDWSSAPLAGELLYALWERGATLSPDRVAAELGFDGIDRHALVAELQS